MKALTPAASLRHSPWLTVLLVAILLLALGLRFYRLGAQSLWNDEGTSVAVAGRDLGTIAQDAANDIHPPLYYWLLSGWLRTFGSSEAAVRSLSALLGVALVALIYAVGRWTAGRWAGALAALLAAMNPFQVYYSQEARGYMLLAVLSAGAVLALLDYTRRGRWPALAIIAGLEAAGLYTHYAFVFVVVALNLALLLWLLWVRPPGVARKLLPWIGSQVAALLLFVPWLPIALRQVAVWPSPAPAAGLGAALVETWRWLVFGPAIETASVAVPLAVTALWAVGGAAVLGYGRVGDGGAPAMGHEGAEDGGSAVTAYGGTGSGGALGAPRSVAAGRWHAAVLVLWLGLPILLLFSLGLYREAYLKFLLVTSPALCALLAAAVLPGPRAADRSRGASSPGDGTPAVAAGTQPIWLQTLRLVATLGLVTNLVVSGVAFRNYYAGPAYARDDYRGIAAYVEAVGRLGDAIVLNAPGQQEVFGYYYDGPLPVYPLPAARPPDQAATEKALAGLVQPGGRIFAVLWATDESDPERIVEGWLDSHAYKALDSWYGNVRLATYAVPFETPQAPAQALDVRFASEATGDAIVLRGYSLLLGGDGLAAGDIAQVSLFWQVAQTPARRYKVFLHVLDDGNHIVGQRDSEPGGGARLTTLWVPGEQIADNYGLPVHPATPPGIYRVEAGLYDAETGRRLVTSDGAEQIWLAPLTVERPGSPAPAAALGMQHDEPFALGDLALLGYDAHKLGEDAQAEPRLRPGEVLEVALYWRAEGAPQGDWQISLSLVKPDGEMGPSLSTEPVPGYPTSRWQAGDVWRGLSSLAIPANAPAGDYHLRLEAQAPDGGRTAALLAAPVRAEP